MMRRIRSRTQHATKSTRNDYDSEPKSLPSTPSSRKKRDREDDTLSSDDGEQQENIVRAKIPTLLPITEEGEEQVTDVQETRMDKLNKASASARNDEILAETLQLNRMQREHALPDSSKARSKKRSRLTTTLKFKKSTLGQVAFINNHCVLCHDHVVNSGGNQSRHFKRSHPQISDKIQSMKESHMPQHEGVIALKSMLFDSLVGTAGCQLTSNPRSKQLKISQMRKPNPIQSHQRHLVAVILDAVVSARGFWHFNSGVSQLRFTSLHQTPPSPTTARRIFNLITKYCREELVKSMSTNTLMNITADGWTKRGAEIIGITGHWIFSNWTIGRCFIELVDIQSYASSGAISAQAVLNAVQDRMPDSVQLFVTTTDNAATARLTGDALSGYSGNGCICHILSLCVKTDIIQNFAPAARLKHVFDKIRSISTWLTRSKLRSALSQVQFDDGVPLQHVRQLQESNDTRWHSILSMIESYIALSGALQKLQQVGAVKWERDSLLTGEELRDIIALQEVLNLMRKASRQLEASKYPTMARCGPTLVALLEQLDEHTRRYDALQISKDIACALIKSIWTRCGDAITSCSWMTVAMAFSPRFADLSFLERAGLIATNQGIETCLGINSVHWGERIKYVRSQIIRRIIFESSSTSVQKLDEQENEKSHRLSKNNGTGSGPMEAEFVISEDEEDSSSKLIELALKNIARIARTRTEQQKVSAESLLNAECGEVSRTNGYDVDDELNFWSLIDALSHASRNYLRPNIMRRVETLDKVRDILADDYCLRGKHAAEAITKLLDFLRSNERLVKAVLSIQASSAESERLFSFADRAVKIAPSRQLRTIADMAIVKTHVDVCGFESDVPEDWKEFLDPMVKSSCMGQVAFQSIKHLAPCNSSGERRAQSSPSIYGRQGGDWGGARVHRSAAQSHHCLFHTRRCLPRALYQGSTCGVHLVVRLFTTKANSSRVAPTSENVLCANRLWLLPMNLTSSGLADKVENNDRVIRSQCGAASSVAPEIWKNVEYGHEAGGDAPDYKFMHQLSARDFSFQRKSARTSSFQRIAQPCRSMQGRSFVWCWTPVPRRASPRLRAGFRA
eukprot:IDg6659t1